MIFPKYEFNMFSQNVSSIDNCFIYFTDTFCRHDRSGHYDQGSQMMSDRDYNPINDDIHFGRFRY